MKFNRGDLILDRSPKYPEYTVYILIMQCSENLNEDSYWWIHNLGEPSYSCRWNKFIIEKVLIHKNFAIKLIPESLNKEKQKAYQEFKTKYLDTDLV